MTVIYNSGTTNDSYRQWRDEQRRIKASDDELTAMEWRWLFRVIKANIAVPTAWIPLNIATQRRIHAKFQRIGWLDDDGLPAGALASYMEMARGEVL